MRSFSNTGEFFEFIIKNFKGEKNKNAPKKKRTKKTEIEKAEEEASKIPVTEKFLYVFFKEKKDAEAQRLCDITDFSSNDRYIRLKSIHLAYKKGVKTKEEYCEAFYAANKNTKAGRSNREQLFKTDPGLAQEQLEERLLREYIDRFIDNAQRSRFLRSAKENNGEKNSSDRNENIDTIEMLHEYDKFSEGMSEFVSAQRLEECKKMYETLRNEDIAFVPLYIDRSSGAGIYIIGKHSLCTDEAKACVVTFYGSQKISPDDEAKVNIMLSGGERSLDNDYPVLPVEMKLNEICSDVEEAFAVLENIIDTGMCFSEYIGSNNDMLLDKVDESFLPFFTETKEAREEIIEKGKEKNAP